VFSEFPTIKMARTMEWKLVHYPKAKYGELYHLAEDPHELTNLYADPKYASARADMQGFAARLAGGESGPESGSGSGSGRTGEIRQR
jgi:arylsulfatase A-like enzyme